ncbi:hypothetical protein N2152v2_000600 [Parachlorella kessleri]
MGVPRLQSRLNASVLGDPGYRAVHDINMIVKRVSRQGALSLALLLVLGCLAAVGRAASPDTAVLLLQLKTFFDNGDAILGSWAGSDPCGQGPQPWRGVNCTSSERPWVLGLSGTIESWTANNWTLPTTVQLLDLSFNALEGGLPSVWHVPSQLRELDLDGNRLAGTLPAWGGRAALQVIIRPGNPGICTRQDFLAGPPPPAGSGSAYTYSSGANMTTLPNCGDAGSLASMMAAATPLAGSGVNPMAGWPDSEDSITCDMTSGDIINIHLSKLHGLSGYLPEAALIYASGLHSLQELDLSHGALGGALPSLWVNASMAGFFPALRRLDVSGNGLTGSLAPALAILPPNLTELALEDNKLTGSLPASWTLPNLTVSVRPGNPGLCLAKDQDPVLVNTTGGAPLAACAAPSSTPSSTSSSKAEVLAAVIGVVGGTVAMGIVAWCCWWRKRRKRTAQLLKGDKAEDLSSGSYPEEKSDLEQQPLQGQPAAGVFEQRAGGERPLMHNTKSGTDAERGAIAVSLAVGDAVGRSDTPTQHEENRRRLDKSGLRNWVVDFRTLDVNYKEPIGEGSYGRVYFARWQHTAVAVKILVSTALDACNNKAAQRALSLSNPVLENLQKEAVLLCKLRHPNIVTFMGVCPYPPCVVTEYCERGSLADVLEKAKQSSLAAKLGWLRRVSMMLDTAKGMLLVDSHWRCKITDFNLSKILEDQVGGGGKSSHQGATNPRWLAPEVLEGQPASAKSDVYSFGIVLWEMLTWELPFREYPHFQLIKHVLAHGRPSLPPLQELRGNEAGQLRGLDAYIALMERCWAQAPQERPSFQEVADAIRDIMAQARAAGAS